MSEVQIMEEPTGADAPRCGWCSVGVDTSWPVKNWIQVKGLYFHDNCLIRAVVEGHKYQEVKKVINDQPTYSYVTVITDVWVCRLCGGHTAGYGPSECSHCGAAAHYGSGNGHYVQSDKLK